MSDPLRYSSDVAFTPAVKAEQAHRGSRHAYSRMEEGGSWETRITPELEEFIAAQTSAFIATANSAGQPYIQHRGGPPGFLHVIDAKTIGFVDFAGNRQYITTGNLSENPKAHLFLIDYEQQRRVKIWGEARVVDATPEWLAQLMPDGYAARPEQVIVFTVTAWDSNCPKHIPQRVDAAKALALIAERDSIIASLRSELARLTSSKVVEPA